MTSATLAPMPGPSASNADVWSSLESAAREACVLRAEGREAEALAVLGERLPGLIEVWSAGAGLTTEKAKQALRDMFTRVQQQVATASIARRLVLSSIQVRPEVGSVPGTASLTPGEAAVMRTGSRVSLHRRVPIGDIRGMLDALDEGERMAALAASTTGGSL